MKELYKGNFVKVQSHNSKPGKGLTYPECSGLLLEDAGISEGWDVVEMIDSFGIVRDIYCFSIIRN